MCGRYTLKTPAARLIEFFVVSSLPQLAPRFNIAPTQLVLSIRSQQDQPGQREAVLMKWGLIPFWAKDQKIGNTMINARAETVATKPAFRAAFGKRRCLIPADGFYEWEKVSGGKKQPWLIYPGDQEPFAFAGLWESWGPKESPDDASGSPGHGPGSVLSCTILTTTANRDLTGLHDRMPVILPIEHWAAWLNPGTSKPQLERLLVPLPDGSLSRHRVSTVVNRPFPDSPECIVPLGE